MNTISPNSWLNKIIDSIASLVILILLFPLLLLLVVFIRLESKGPVFCYSYRVGMNYHIFKFYKFRTMHTEAYLLKNQHNNINANQKGIVISELIEPLSRKLILSLNPDKIRIKDDGFVDESEYESTKKDLNPQEISVFKNDPRLTRVGRWIQNMNLDELPQLFNILKGDISLIGSKPLALSEAEKLTSDKSIGDLMRPAGIFELLKLTNEIPKEIPVSKNIELNNQNIKEYNFLLDMKFSFKAHYVPINLQKNFAN
jgi:lipopolysaccharide/colanic/teichoic acid biosynthesis glycosyltransferase